MVIPALTTASAIASLIGGGMSAFGKSRKEQTTQLQTMSPEQQQAQSQALQMSLQGLQNPTEGFQPIADQATENFNTQTIPGLAERFTSLGGGAQRSSAFQGALGRAGAGLQSDLAAQQSQYGLQNRSLLNQLLGMGLSNRFENVYKPQQMGGMQAFGGSLLQGGLSGLSGAIDNKVKGQGWI